MRTSLEKLIPAIRDLNAIVFDFDGVMTTNEVVIHQDGTESVVCNRSDGYGMRLLEECGLRLLILSTEKNPVVTTRANKLKIECIQGIESKGERLQAWMAEHHLAPQTVAYVGNDVNDLPCFKKVALSIAVGDAVQEVKESALWILKAAGGKGAVRELCEEVYRAKKDVPANKSVWAYRDESITQQLC